LENQMPVSVRKSKSQGKTVWKVVDPSGKVHGTHSSKEKATAQVRAINLSELRKKGRKGIPKPKK